MCWNETEEQGTEGMCDLPDKSTHTNAQSKTLPCWTGQPPHRAAQPHTNALILMSDFGLILISNCIKFLDIIHDINVKICKHMFDLNVKHRTIWMWLTLILTSILPDEMASGSDSESLYLVERMGRSNIGPTFGHVVIYYLPGCARMDRKSHWVNSTYNYLWCLTKTSPRDCFPGSY